jgi:alkanesulfonate monooxygenase SsuD/methylene tetrahydromethanopterin reductase-like flavin-dependent oxidoreductase (luciferase family)
MTTDPAGAAGLVSWQGGGMTRPFRFGVVAPVVPDLGTWRDRVRRIADAGYSTLLMPDVPGWQPSPAPALAMAATLAPELRGGTWVYASPFRTGSMLAWEAHSMTELTEGRFELGIGTGRPDIDDDVRKMGMPVVPPGRRLAQVSEAVRTLRELEGSGRRTPVAMAVRGPRAQALAAEVADIVTFAVTQDVTRAEVVDLARGFPNQNVELACHVPVVGDTPEPYMGGTDPAPLRLMDSMAILPQDPAAAIEEVLRRREEAGFTYFVVGGDSAEAFAPVVAELAGTLAGDGRQPPG